ncbi:hypothetical protein M9458_010317, partial [Cirrhinus mrigala]
MHQSDPDPRPDLPEPTVRPRRVVQLPSHLSDLELTNHQQRLQSRQRVDTSEMSDDLELRGAAAPELADTSPEHGTSIQQWQPLPEWSPSRESEQQRAHTLVLPEQLSVVLAEFQQLQKETEELRRHSYGQIRKLTERNEALETQLSLLAVSDRSSRLPQNTFSLNPVFMLRRSLQMPSQSLCLDPSYLRDQDRLHDLEQRLRQLEMISPPTHVRPFLHQSFPQRSYDRFDDGRSGYRPTQLRVPPSQESTYWGPALTIPNFVRPDPREFSHLQIALENIPPVDATERFKYQLLVEHLKIEEVLLIADSYCNSLYPFSNTMEALNQQYGQPHQLALQRIAELMDGPNVSQGDVRAFRMFALKVRSLVSMLQQLGNKGYMELELLCKLPHDMQTRRSVHPQQVPIPALLDLLAWLEFELQVQEEMPIHKKGHQKDMRQTAKAKYLPQYRERQ